MAKPEFDGPFTELSGKGENSLTGFIATYKMGQYQAPLDKIIPTYLSKVGDVIKYLKIDLDKVIANRAYGEEKLSFNDILCAYESNLNKKAVEKWFNLNQEVDFTYAEEMTAKAGKEWIKYIIKKNDPSINNNELDIALKKVDEKHRVELSAMITRNWKLCNKSVYGNLNFDYSKKISVPQVSFLEEDGTMGRDFYVSWLMQLDFRKKV